MTIELELLLKLALGFLVIVDIILLVYTLYYYKQKYKKNCDNIVELLEKIREKISNGTFVRKNPIKEVFDESISEDKPVNPVIEAPVKETFDESYNKLSEEQKYFYDEIIDYALNFDNTSINSYDYERRIRIGQRKILATITIKNDFVVVKIKMGNLKVGNGIEPLKLKPIKIILKTNEDLDDAKKQIEACYLKQTGAININLEEEE